MTTASTLLNTLALSACLTIQAVPGAAESPSGIRRALQTMDRSVSHLIPEIPPTHAADAAARVSPLA
ncbi:hypothetical protein [Nitratireductor sp. ZSWI3]|uniref:hypothetical protein n=1 Tax=Nitratireductor sp. ZSWI3 TaxID=2966359 RepID=UPI0021504BC8|nr:hypothetical protein [Nitratireductor sp. ZSWI3]MCR4269274.1 hypothetical protein [Nitratireductor sp. ZSWI3]